MSGHLAFFGDEDINVAPLLHLGLYGVQHRGQINSGLTVINGEVFNEIRGVGLVSDIYSDKEINKLVGNKGVAHVKYAFADEPLDDTVMPETYEYDKKLCSLSIDGNMIDRSFHQREFIKILNNLDTATEEIGKLKGAFSVIYMDAERMIVIRDPHGIKNISIGKYEDTFVASSETCVFDIVGAEFIKDLEPGEIAIFENGEMRSIFTPFRNSKNCIFEFVYISRQDSYIDGKSVYEARYNMGRRLAEEHPVNADIVIGSPDSGTIAALGYSHESGIQYREGILKNRYVGRTFILPDQKMREKSVKIKMNPLRINLEGKRVVLVDDSIVRGTTIKKTVEMLRNAGATEVHVRVACPPVTTSCNLCVDTPDERYLIGANLSVEETRKEINADSLGYLSLDALIRCCSKDGNLFCKNCFDGNYPIEV